MLNEASINQFIEEYKRSRVIIETTVRSVLQRAEKWEQLLKKDFVDFTIQEALDMFKSAKPISLNGLQNQKLFLIHAAKWFLDSAGKSVDNVFEKITKEDLIGCLDMDRKKNSIISREQLDELQAEMLNATDVAITQLLFIGCSGVWMKDVTYLSEKQISKSDMCVYYRDGRRIEIDQKTYDILMKAFHEDELISYTPGSSKVIAVSIGEIYKVRSNTLYDNNNMKDEVELERRGRWLQRRLAILTDYLGVKLTPKILNASGFWHFAHTEMEEMGIENFRDYLYTNQGKELAYRFGFQSQYYASILLEKYKYNI